LVLAIMITAGTAHAKSVYIARDASLVQADYAARRLAAALEAQGYSMASGPKGYDYLISIAVNRHRLGAEAYAIKPDGRHLTAATCAG
jgi:hypothetical protein